MFASLKPAYWALHRRLFPKPPPDKHAGELEYWLRMSREEGGQLENGWYERLMLKIAGEPDGTFLTDKTVADFGCGPRGTLAWATSARERIGIDVLADAYLSAFDTSLHRMRYVASTEESIPLGDGVIDVLFTINALDHVEHVDMMCRELRRILRPGGELIGSFNLNEPPTPTEPLMLTAEMIDDLLLRDMEVMSRRIAPRGSDPEHRYAHFHDNAAASAGEPSFMWVRARKPSDQSTSEQPS